jgi:hypothetical protein
MPLFFVLTGPSWSCLWWQRNARLLLVGPAAESQVTRSFAAVEIATANTSVLRTPHEDVPDVACCIHVTIPHCVAPLAGFHSVKNCFVFSLCLLLLSLLVTLERASPIARTGSRGRGRTGATTVACCDNERLSKHIVQLAPAIATNL